MRKMKIGKRLTLSFGVILVFLVAALGFATIMMLKMANDTDTMFANNVTPLYDLDEVSAQANGLTTQMFMAVVNQNDADAAAECVEEIKEIQAIIQESLDNYKIAYDNNDNPIAENVRLTNEVITLWGNYNPMINKVVSFLENGQYEEATAYLMDTEVRATRTALRESAKALFDTNLARAREINDQQSDDSHTTIYILLAIAVVCILVSIAIALFLIRSITNPVNELKDAMNEMANGNLELSINSNMPDEMGELMRYARRVIDVVNSLVSDINKLAKDFDLGDIESRIDATRYTGSYEQVAKGVNSATGGVVGDVLTFMECLNDFGNGDFNADMPQLPGKKVIMNENLNKMRDNLKSIATDIDSLINHAADGELSSRADSGKYKGDWAALLDNLNHLLEVIVEPINEASSVLSYVAQGNFDYKVNGDYQGDFLVMKGSINDTVSNIASYISEISEVLTYIANKDLNKPITREYVGEFANIKNAINNITDTLSMIISEILSASEQVASGARQISESSMTLATGATEQASSVEKLNSTILDINDNTVKNVSNAKDAEHLSGESKDSAAKGDNDMNNMLTAMNGIKESSDSIAKIIKVIDDIAFQTNLLALNAAVEAARAGEHGKGFAVVAEEVRTLAGRSKNAAQETAELIEESINRVNEGSKIALETASALQTIVDNVTKVSDIITGIATASSDQASSVAQVTQGIAQISEVVQNNSATSEEAASASEELSSQAEMLQNLVSEFKLKNS